jgi:SSS family solute:Na+ symporter
MNFLHFAAWLFVVCSGLLVLGSFTTAAPSVERVRGLVYGMVVRDDDVGAGSLRLVVLSVVLLVCVGVIWVVFR